MVIIFIVRYNPGRAVGSRSRPVHPDVKGKSLLEQFGTTIVSKTIQMPDLVQVWLYHVGMAAALRRRP